MRAEEGNYINVNEFEKCIFKVEIAIASAVILQMIFLVRGLHDIDKRRELD